ncbi:AAA family ATPase [Undibacterium sp. TC9W]|uniref:AAA family ATPase n=1 Tax=Undibacterium sp. TC9W TaxID=3413053 RepID=UPI003BF0A6E5
MTNAGNQYLKGIKDVVFDIELKQNFQENAGFKLSLARFSSAMQALSDAPELFTTTPKVEIGNNSTGPSFTFQTKLSKEANDLSINFNFNPTPDIPNRINVVIGYNGTGKTQLLSKLATVTSGYGYKRKKDLLSSETGKFVDSAPNFGGVVVVSYSAFDTFEIPGQDESERSHLDLDGGFFGYTYCGLRKVIRSDNNEPIYGLKDHREIRAEYSSALHRIREQGRQEIFLKILAPITNEASFQKIGISQGANSLLDDQNFLLLSTGHKIVLTIVAQLTSLLEKERRMLVIMDEPEAHLHPPLLASLLHSFRICMEEFDAYSIISTHSPVVLQETPSKYVRILRRIGNSSQVSLPLIETFGENIGVITKDIFNLSDETTDWHDVLNALAKDHSLETIEEKFGKRLGFSARSYVMSLIDER